MPHPHSPDLIVFSHLRWDFVTQRPQHLMKRFSRQRRVLFVEEPLPPNGKKPGEYRLSRQGSNLWVLQIWDSTFSPLRFYRVIQTLRQKLSFDAFPILWFYSPAFVPLTILPHRLIVYDCMDELSQFKGASRSLGAWEKQLLAEADLVFTGGRSLYRSKKKSHPQVYCFESSVDAPHFAKAASGQLPLPTKIKKIPHPILGFYGVLDERLDLRLIKAAAAASPQISFVYIGPVVKIDPQSLPVLPNLHYLGPIPYRFLPRYLQVFDIAFMPFALNRATRYISPTKTLEFIAAHKPIISTAVHDVVAQYSDLVKIIHSVKDFKIAVNALLQETATNKITRHRLEQSYLKATSWDQTVKSMDRLLHQALLSSNLNFSPSASALITLSPSP